MLTRLAGAIWLLIVTVMFGGVSLLRLLIAGDMLNDWEIDQFRAGHAHAGVLLIMALAYVVFLERTIWTPTRRRLALGVFMLGGIAQSGGFFLHMLVGEPENFSAGTALTLAGALLLAAAVIALGVSLLRHAAPAEEDRVTAPDPARMRADFPKGTVVFLIGMRFNTIWRVDHWLPVFTAMPRMVVELMKNPELGLLGAKTWVSWRNVMVVQYWRDMDALMAYSASPEGEHLPAWRTFNRRLRRTSSVGIWHEAYVVGPETSHTVYRAMPPHGMGAAIERVEAIPARKAVRQDGG